MDILMDIPFSCACLFSPCLRSVLLECGECSPVTLQRPMRAMRAVCTWSSLCCGVHAGVESRHPTTGRGRIQAPTRNRARRVRAYRVRPPHRSLWLVVVACCAVSRVPVCGRDTVWTGHDVYVFSLPVPRKGARVNHTDTRPDPGDASRAVRVLSVIVGVRPRA